MLCLFVAALLSIASTSTASIQKPVITPCSDTHVVVISDLTIINATVGQTVVIQYSGQLTQDIGGSPTTKLTLSKRKGGIKIPCIADVGSCEYKLCDGTSAIEKELGSPWNNTCPIPAGNYIQSVSIYLPRFLRYLIGDGKVYAKVEILTDGNVLECQQAFITIDR